jgi:hypothetical protein
MTGAGRSMSNKIGCGYARPRGRTGVVGVGGGGRGEFPQRGELGVCAWRLVIGRRWAGFDRGSQLEARDLRPLRLIEGNQGLGGSVARIVAWPASHGLGQGVDRTAESRARRLIVNLTEGLAGQTGRRPSSSLADRARCGAAVEAGAGGLPPFANRPPPWGVASGGPGIGGKPAFALQGARSRSIAAASPGALICSILRPRRATKRRHNGSGPGSLSQNPKNEVRGAGRRARDRRGDRASAAAKPLASGYAGPGLGHGRQAPFGERIPGGYALERGAVNRHRERIGNGAVLSGIGNPALTLRLCNRRPLRPASPSHDGWPAGNVTKRQDGPGYAICAICPPFPYRPSVNG